MVKKLVRIFIFLAIIILIYLGVMRKEFIEIFRNSTLLCLSCIGIQ